MIGRLKELTAGLFTKKQLLTVEVDEDISQIFLDLKDKDLDIKLKPHKKKRSLDQNAYAWELIGQIAKKIRSTPDEVYFQMLKRYGVTGLVKIRAKDEKAILREIKYYEMHEKLYDEDAKYYRIFVGSSNYDTEEFKAFLDGIISECKQLGIDPSTPYELALLRSYENGKLEKMQVTR